VAYCRTRLADDPHLWASTLLDELADLGYDGGYSTFTRALRRYQLRPHCEPCQATRGRDVAIITHPAGEETQWDWVELPDPPATWGVGQHAHLLVGALAHSGRWRAVLAGAEDFPHLVEALDTVVGKLGGTTQVWRFDRMATVCYPVLGPVDRGVRAGRQALRGPLGGLPVTSREPQRRGGEGKPLGRATLVAHAGR
jgi:hypothetical protein